MKRWNVWAGILVLVAALSAVLAVRTFVPEWLGLGAPTPDRASPSPTPIVAKERDPVPALQRNAARATPVSAVGLPTESIAPGHADAVRRAMRGDLVAACEESKKLNQCAARAQALNAAGQIQEAMASGGTSTDDKAMSNVARLLNSGERSANQCAGVTDDMLKDAYDLQKLASSRGLRYKRWLATNPALDQNNFVQDAERWADYRHNAARYFEQALRSRDLDDLSALILVYYPGEILLPRPPYRSPDAAKFLALYEVALANNIALPPAFAQTAGELRKNNQRPDPAVAGPWNGQAPKSVEHGVSEAMFPDVTANFCQ